MYREWKRQAGGWPRGADGALSIDGTTVKILAGDIKDYYLSQLLMAAF